MLTASQIDAIRDISTQLLDPVIDFLIGDIARRVSEAGQLTTTASYQIWRAQNLGMSQKQIMKEIQKRLKIPKAEVEQLLIQAAKTGYNFDLSRFPNKRAVPFAANSSIQQIVNAAVKLAQEDLSNIVQTIGFVCPDGKVHNLAKAYHKACDFAFSKVVTGAQDFHSALRDATRGLAEKGILRIDYESGVHTSLEAAVRRNIMGGLGLMQEQISQQNHDDLGCNGWEISAHSGSAPDHEPIQGKQYSDKVYKRLNDSLKRRIGTLNCGHAASPIILGVNEPQYTPEELEQFRHENEEGVTVDGKHYTKYEATQRQRGLERAARKQKRRILIDEAAGDTEKLQQDQIKLVRIRQEYKRFSDAAGLRMQHERMDTAGFTWKHGKAAEKAAKNGPAKTGIKTTAVTDVTQEYSEKATPGIGSITYDHSYDKLKHKHEIAIAEWLQTNLGGDIRVQNESTKDGEKMSDYLWNGKRWELKGPSTEKAPDSALRSALAQIVDNPGGVILDFKDSDIVIDDAINTINRRMLRPESLPVDVIVIHKGKLIKVLRYKK